MKKDYDYVCKCGNTINVNDAVESGKEELIRQFLEDLDFIDKIVPLNNNTNVFLRLGEIKNKWGKNRQETKFDSIIAKSLNDTDLDPDTFADNSEVKDNSIKQLFDKDYGK